jgi:hypothetical protein
MLTKGSKEGLNTMSVQTKSDINNLLKNKGLSYLEKIVRIKAIMGSDSVLNDIYNQNEATWYKSILTILESYPPYQENTVTKDEAERINSIVLDASQSRLDKIVNIYPLIGKDIQLQNVYEQYSNVHINLIQNYIDTIAPQESPLP